MKDDAGILETVVNISEGTDLELVATIASAAGDALLDVHSDPHHNRSVLTIAGPGASVMRAARAVAERTVRTLDLRSHGGVHPRIGVLDVVPWTALEHAPSHGAPNQPSQPSHGATNQGAPNQRAPIQAAPPPEGSSQTAPIQGSPIRRLSDGPLEIGLAARDEFATWAAASLGLPCFLYGPGRSLPEIRRQAWKSAGPDLGPSRPHRTAGATAVGARPILVAYNLCLVDADLATSKAVAAAIRGQHLRALGLMVGGRAQVSCNLIHPFCFGPGEVFDLVAERWAVESAELVGLVPVAVLDAIPQGRWAQLDLSSGRTIEARLERAGLDGGRFD